MDIFRTIGATIGACIFTGLVWLWVREINYDLNVVDTKVELQDGTVYLCVEADSRRDSRASRVEPLRLDACLQVASRDDSV